MYKMVNGEVVEMSAADRMELDSIKNYYLSKETELKEKHVRQLRNDLLSACDWTQVEDAPVDKQEWSAYRQKLRDITNQQGFPHDVIWPIAPSK